MFELDTSNINTQIRSGQKNISNSSKSIESYKEDIKNLNIYATTSGYVSDLNYSVGDNVNKNSLVFKITNDDYYYLDCFFYYNSSVDIKVGDKVRVILNVDYDTDRAFNLYYDEYDVIQINGDRAVIGIGNTVTSAINIRNIERV